MKIVTVGFCVLSLMVVASSAKAQCGCGTPAPRYAAPVHSYHAPVYSAPVHSYHAPVVSAPRVMSSPMSSPMTGRSMPAGQIAYVNQLTTPVPRANYTLNYAVHLTDGRILLSDFVPAGHTVRGMETHSGAGGRRLNTSGASNGLINVVDPVNNNTIATFSTMRK